jgi:Ca2+-binding EF-hand superfamily protein
MNVFRYDKDGDRKITYDEIADFLLEMHSGEMAIQRMHLNETYKRGAERIMDLMEFVLTVNYALSFFGIEADEASLRQLFFDIDQNGDGWITYQEYF